MSGDTTAKASDGGIAAGRDQTFNLAPSPELLEALRRPDKERSDDQRKEIQDLKDKLGTSEGILNRIAGILMLHLEEGDIQFDQIPARLTEMVKQRQAVVERERSRAPDPDAAFAELQDKLAAALDAGDDDLARELLREKRDAKLAAAAKRREAVDRLRDAATRDLLDAAESEAGLGDIAVGRLEYRIAAGHFGAAAELLSADAAHATAQLDYLDRTAKALYSQGNEYGDNDALAEAVQAYRAILERRPRQDVPLDWAMTQNDLGNALQALGERESGTVRLEAAVAAYEAALEEWTRERVPLDWAMTQNNLGNALGILGERESDPDLLAQALAAIRNSYEMYVKEAGLTQYEDDFLQRMETLEEAIAKFESDG